ncbi:60S ribosomal protein L8 [Pelomyxa schiedti]|nr:60S ribosomal protein L8 [Pelomyxa schiedti]
MRGGRGGGGGGGHRGRGGHRGGRRHEPAPAEPPRATIAPKTVTDVPKAARPMERARGRDAVVSWAALDPECRYLAMIGASSTLRVVDCATNEVVGDFNDTRAAGSCTCACWGTKSQIATGRSSKIARTNDPVIVLGNSAGEISVWELLKGEVSTKLSRNKTPVSSVACSKSAWILSGNIEGEITQWDLISGTVLMSCTVEGRVNNLCIFDDDHTFAAAAQDIQLFDTVGHVKIKGFVGHKDPTQWLSCSTVPTPVLVSVSSDLFVYGWNCNPNEQFIDDIALQTLTLDAAPHTVDIATVGKTKKTNLVLVVSTKGVHVAQWDSMAAHLQMKRGTPSESITFDLMFTSSSLPVIAASFTNAGSALTIARSDFVETWFETINVFDYATCTLLQHGTIPLVERDLKRTMSKARATKAPVTDIDFDVATADTTSAIPAIGSDKDTDYEGQLHTLYSQVTKTKDSPSAQTTSVKAGSLQSVLEQALITKDKALLEDCLKTNKLSVIQSTVQRLSVNSVIPLLNALVPELDGSNQTALIWVKTILTEHATHIMAIPNVNSALSDLYLTLQARTSAYKKLVNLSGRLQITLSQASRVHPDFSETEPVVYLDEEELAVAPPPVIEGEEVRFGFDELGNSDGEPETELIENGEEQAEESADTKSNEEEEQAEEEEEEEEEDEAQLVAEEEAEESDDENNDDEEEGERGSKGKSKNDSEEDSDMED